MIIHRLHAWTTVPSEARQIQKMLRDRVRQCRLQKTPELVAGADVSYERSTGMAYAGVVVLRLADLQLVETATAHGATPFPYVPGLLTFREAPVLLQAFAKLTVRPDVIIFDGQGIAHPLNMGLAAHMGLWLQIPSIGCAKKKLVGDYELPGSARGQFSELRAHSQVIGAAVRTKNRVKPVFVSPGHLITLRESIDLVLRTCTAYRLPEPTRQAHLLVNRLRMEFKRQNN